MKFGQRLRSRFWRLRVEDEVDAELEFHVEMRARELVGQGLSPAEAREAAIRKFGNITQVNTACRALGLPIAAMCNATARQLALPSRFL